MSHPNATVASDEPTNPNENKNMPDITNNETARTNEELLDLLERFKQQIELLNQANTHLKSQLSAALAVNHTPLLRFGESTAMFILNARSIEALHLEEGVKLTSPPMPSGLWRVMVDERAVTGHLEPGAALAKLLLIERQWIEALEPPE